MLLNTRLQLTKRGQILKNAKQVYLSTDIPCSISNCVVCEQPPQDNLFDPSNIIYFVDTDVLEHNLDIIEQSALITNVLILQSSVSHMSKFINKSVQLRNFIDATYNKSIYVYQNEFSTVT